MYIEYCWYIEYRLRWNLNYWRIVLIQTNRFFNISVCSLTLRRRSQQTDNRAYRAWLKIWVFHCNCWTLDRNRQFPFLSGYEFLKYESWNKKEEPYCLCWRYHRNIFLLFLPIFSKIKDAMVFIMSFVNIHNDSLNESEASHGFKTVQRLCTWNKPLANVLMMFSYVSDHPMAPFFDIHLAISSIHGKISFEFRFWAHFFAFQNPDTRLKIFPTALKKFALRAEKRISKFSDTIENFDPESSLPFRAWKRIDIVQ